MSITVADCLKCVALREAKLIAGADGLSRTVTSVSVMEWPEVPVLTDDVIVGNELIISALVQIKDDVEKQCRLLRHMHGMGMAGMVLFYVGVFIPEIDDRLAALADELHFPLIVMPYGRMDFRYCDVIADVMEMILQDRRQERYYVSDVMNQISMLVPQHRTVTSVLRLLADRLRCSLILTDRYLERRGAAAWPLSNQWDYQQILTAIQSAKIPANDAAEVELEANAVRVWYLPIESMEYRGLRLFVLDEQRQVGLSMLRQAADVIAMFLNIWDRGAYDEGTDALVQAVLSDNPAEMLRFASRLKISMDSVHTMWLLRITHEDGNECPDQIPNAIFRLKSFLSEYHKLIVIDSYERYVVVFCDDLLFDGRERELGDAFAKDLRKDGLRVRGAVFEALQNTTEARAAYVSMCEHFEALCRVYPFKTIFTESEFRFIRYCRECMDGGEEQLRDCLAPLTKIRTLSDGPELIETLCTYLLDAEGGSQRTGEILYLHKNTVNYRLNKIRSILNHDLNEMPAAFSLHRAVALRRLLDNPSS